MGVLLLSNPHLLVLLEINIRITCIHADRSMHVPYSAICIFIYIYTHTKSCLCME